jgi:Dipeptidyl peptidase IV (DPP IV) N-terminal region
MSTLLCMCVNPLARVYIYIYICICVCVYELILRVFSFLQSPRAVNTLVGPTFLTAGEWDVTKVNAYVPTQNKLYLTTTQSSSIQRELYSVVLDLGAKAVSDPQLEGTAGVWTSCSFPQAQPYGYSSPSTYYFVQQEGDWSFENVPQSILQSLDGRMSPSSWSCMCVCFFFFMCAFLLAELPFASHVQLSLSLSLAIHCNSRSTDSRG